MIDRVLAGDRELRDEGALREMSAVAPQTADRFASYLAFPFPREARARAQMATFELAVGKTRWRPAEAMARLRLGDGAERASALSLLQGLDLDALEQIAPEARARGGAKSEPAKAGSILLPTPELMVELGLVSGSPAPVEAGPDRTRELADLVLGFAEAASGRRPMEYGE